MDRKNLHDLRPKVVFVAESPHTSEVEPEDREERRPLCGAAGKKWWGLLGRMAGDGKGEDVSLDRMLELCQEQRVALLNAVQYPLDEGIKKKVPGAEPVANLGFCKNPGPKSYKKLRDSAEVRQAVEALRARLNHPSLKDAEIHCLGNDAEWFVTRALEPAEYEKRVRERLPHPSAWWRRGGYFGRVAEELLSQITGRLSKKNSGRTSK
jgi:hypothetical protein